jgi:hypothetical protein
MSKSHFDDHGFDEFDREPEILTEYYDDHYDLPRTINGMYIAKILAMLLEVFFIEKYICLLQSNQ